MRHDARLAVVTGAAIFAASLASPADARPQIKHHHVQRVQHVKHHVPRHRKPVQRRYIAPRTIAQGTILPHPRGCPGRAFCGCGASIKVFGQSIRSLWLASNWYRFPRSQPASGNVAVRSHHVFVLEEYVGGNNWLVYDANSGGHQTRRHVRSIAGYTIVNPHRTQYAALQ